MGVFNNQNTFYNSTWHLYLVPEIPEIRRMPQIPEAPKILYKPYTTSWEEFKNKPFNVDFDQFHRNLYDDIPQYIPLYEYNGVGFMKGNKLTQGLTYGLNGASGLLGMISGGTGSKVGNYVLSAGLALSNIPGVPGLIGSFINLGASAYNSLLGYKKNDANIRAMDAMVNGRARWLFGDNSTTDALIAGSLSNVDLASPDSDFYSKDGLLANLRGTGKGDILKYNYDRLIRDANSNAASTEALAYKDHLNNMIRRGLLLPFALGGYLNKYDKGGNINTPFTHGSLFSNGLVQINNGGSHELNPNQGVLFGMDEMGIPNLVEEGETIFNAGAYGGPDNYSFSDRIEFPMEEYGEMFALGGRTKRMKGKRAKSYTFADISKLLSKESEERPNDEKSLRTLAENLGKLAMALEEVKARDMLELMNPLDIVTALQQSPMGELMVGDTLQTMDLLAMEQEPVMAAYGGNLYRRGGRTRRRGRRRSRSASIQKDANGNIIPIPIYEGNFGTAFSAARNNGNTIFEWNGKTYNTRLRGESDDAYNKYIASKLLPILAAQLKLKLKIENSAEADRILNDYAIPEIAEPGITPVTPTEPALPSEPIVPQYEYIVPDSNLNPLIRPLSNIDENGWLLVYNNFDRNPFGVNIFAKGGNTNGDIAIVDNPLYNIQSQYGLLPFNINEYVLDLTDPRVFKRRRSSSRRSSSGSGGGSRTNRLNNQTIVNGQAVNNIPLSLALHDELFNSAIENWVKTQYDNYQNLEREGKYLEAYDIAKNLLKDIIAVNTYYINAMRNPTGENIERLQTKFEELGLNKDVNAVLNKLRDVDGELRYPVQHYDSKGNLTDYLSDNPLDKKNGVITQNRFLRFTEAAKNWLTQMGLSNMTYLDYLNSVADENFRNEYGNISVNEQDPDYYKNLDVVNIGPINDNLVIRNPNYKEGSDKPGELNKYIPISEDILQYAPEEYAANSKEWWDNLNDELKAVEIAKYYNTYGDLTRSGVYENRLVYEPIDRPYPEISEASESSSSSSSSEKTSNSSTKENGDKDKTYFVPKPRSDWESKAALGVALGDYVDAMFGNGRTFQSPGTNAAYDYLSRVGNIPMVRNTPTGTKITYRPVDLNYGINDITNNIFGTIRTVNNLNQGLATANTIATMNAGRDAISKARAQAIDDNLKILQSVLANNNQVDQFNSQNSLTALSTNAQNLARAREALATGAAQLAGTLAQSYNNWLNYRNTQSSGLALMLYDLGYNKQMLNLRDAAFLLNNQQPDVLNTAGIQYQVYNPALQQGNYPYIVVQTDNKNK